MQGAWRLRERQREKKDKLQRVVQGAWCTQRRSMGRETEARSKAARAGRSRRAWGHHACGNIRKGKESEQASCAVGARRHGRGGARAHTVAGAWLSCVLGCSPTPRVLYPLPLVNGEATDGFVSGHPKAKEPISSAGFLDRGDRCAMDPNIKQVFIDVHKWVRCTALQGPWRGGDVRERERVCVGKCVCGCVCVQRQCSCRCACAVQ